MSSKPQTSQWRETLREHGSVIDPDGGRFAGLPAVEGYEILAAIGRGGMGAVYEAMQCSTGSRVAIKFMLEPPGASDALRRRFEREVDLIARLHHPNIVRLLDSGVQRGLYYYVMEHVEGRPLGAAFRPGQCGPRDVLPVIAQICETVDFAHQRGILHRDLKPSNVLIDEQGQPHLLDFGLAKSMDPSSGAWLDVTLSEPGQVLGTLGYMSPEQSRGRMDGLSVRSDVYSLGAIGYELLTGRLPCALDGSLAEILSRIETADPSRPSALKAGLSADIDAILLKALRKEPAGRFATAGEMAADLRRHLADRPILARPTPALARLARWTRRNRALATVGTVAALLLVSGGVFSVARIARERGRAIANEQLAREKLRFALDAVDRLVFDTDTMLAELLGTTDVRQQLLDVALGFYEALPRDAALLGLEELTGPQYGRLGDALYARGDRARAAQFYRLSLAAARAVTQNRTTDDRLARDLAFALERAATIESDPIQRRAALREALEVQQGRLVDGPNSAAVLADVALAWMRLAEDAASGGDERGAERSARQALDVQKAACAAGSGSPEGDLALLALQGRLMLLRRSFSDGAALLSTCTEAMDRAQRLADQWPAEVEVQLASLSTLSQGAGLLIEAEECARADAALGSARQTVEQLILEHPEELRFRLAAADVYAYIGNAALARNERPAALYWFQRCNAVVAPAFELQPNDVRYRRRYAQSLASIGAAQWEENQPAAAARAYEGFLAASEPLIAAEPDHIRTRAYAWHAVGWHMHATDSARALACYQRGVQDLDRLAARRPLDDYELGLRRDLLRDARRATAGPVAPFQ